MFLSVKNISKSFQREKGSFLTVLDTINLSINEGDFVSIIGPSGCGKSTLLSIIAGLTKSSSGSVFLEGSKITSAGPDKSMVFQEAALFPWMTVSENISFPLRKKMKKNKRLELVSKYLQMVHLSKFANHYPHELSGGMQQRVSIARALAMDAKLLLMDEPFSALDEQTRTVLQEELESIWLATNKTVVFVTHSIREAIKLSDRIIIIGARPGTIISDFKVDLDRPRLQVDMAEMEQKVRDILKVEIDKVMEEELYHVASN